MKKLAFLCMLLALFAGSIETARAQRTTSPKTVTTTKLVGVEDTFEYTEAVKLESGHEMLISPLVASVKVLSNNNDGRTFEHKVFTGSARVSIPNGLANNEYLVSKLSDGKRTTNIDIEMLKAEVIYDFCRETNADLIVAPQFNIHHKTVQVAAIDAYGNDTTIDVPVERNGRYVMVVDVVGFPAVYSGFREGTREDGWIKDMFNRGQIKNETTHLRSESETVVHIK